MLSPWYVSPKQDQDQQFETFFETSLIDEINEVKKVTGCPTPCSYKEYKFLTSAPKKLFMPFVPDDQIGILLWAMSRDTDINEEVL